MSVSVPNLSQASLKKNSSKIDFQCHKKILKFSQCVELVTLNFIALLIETKIEFGQVAFAKIMFNLIAKKKGLLCFDLDLLPIL